MSEGCNCFFYPSSVHVRFFFSCGFQASVSYLNALYILCIYWHFNLYLALGPGPMLSHVTLGAMQCLEMVVYWLDYTATYQQLYKYKHDLNCFFSASSDLSFLSWSLSINTNIYRYLHVHTHTYALKKKILKCLLSCTQQHSTGIHENFQHPTRKIFILYANKRRYMDNQVASKGRGYISNITRLHPINTYKLHCAVKNLCAGKICSA